MNNGHKVKESDIKRSIRQYLTCNKWFVINIFQTLGCAPGIADLFAIRNGRGVWIEVKTATGRQSDKQKEFQKNIEHHGGIYIIARSIDDLKVIE